MKNLLVLRGNEEAIKDYSKNWLHHNSVYCGSVDTAKSWMKYGHKFIVVNIKDKNKENKLFTISKEYDYNVTISYLYKDSNSDMTLY